MKITIHPSEIQGTVNAPPSKSLMQRAIAAAILVRGETIILNVSHCADSLSALGMAKNFGVEVYDNSAELRIISNGLLTGNHMHCGESGLAMRMFAPIAALQNHSYQFTGDGSLCKRPVGMIGDALEQLGVNFSSTKGFLPFWLKGPLKGGVVNVDGSISSQLLSGLLMALPIVEMDSEIKVLNLKSKPYISMTMQLLAKFGVEVSNNNFEHFRIKGRQYYKPITFYVEGDWSGASFLLAAAAIRGDVKVKGLNFNSLQADKSILEALKLAETEMDISNDSIHVSKSNLKAFAFDATHCPDLFPPLVALAAYCKGVSSIKGVRRLIHKESNRAKAIQQEMNRLGIELVIADDEMIIKGGSVNGNIVNSHNDHRIAMMLAVVALASKTPVTISDAACVDKSYPDFFTHFKQLGAIVEQQK